MATHWKKSRREKEQRKQAEPSRTLTSMDIVFLHLCAVDDEDRMTITEYTTDTFPLEEAFRREVAANEKLKKANKVTLSIEGYEI